MERVTYVKGCEGFAKELRRIALACGFDPNPKHEKKLSQKELEDELEVINRESEIKWKINPNYQFD